METLVCQSCESEWTRKKARGRKPKFCTSCVSSKDATKDNPKKIVPIVSSIQSKSIYCQHRMHYMCTLEAQKFEQYRSCACGCHAT